MYDQINEANQLGGHRIAFIAGEHAGKGTIGGKCSRASGRKSEDDTGNKALARARSSCTTRKAIAKRTLQETESILR